MIKFMKFELEFDKDVYNKQMDLLFDLNWKKKKDYYKNSQYLGLILYYYWNCLNL